MKWSNRIQIVTGQTCVHIALHFLLIAALVWGWKNQKLLHVSTVLLALYASVFVMMLFTQRLPNQRRIGDFIEDVTTTYYFGAAMLALLVLSWVIHNNLLLGVLGVVMLAGPVLLSLLTRERAQSLRQRPRWTSVARFIMNDNENKNSALLHNLSNTMVGNARLLGVVIRQSKSRINKPTTGVSSKKQQRSGKNNAQNAQ